VPSVEFLDSTIRRQLKALHQRLKNDFAHIDKPADLTREIIDVIATSNNELTRDELAGTGCIIGEKAYESTLCAANGAGHQNLILPVIPRGRIPLTIGSERRGGSTFFYWGLWNVPASYYTVRSLLGYPFTLRWRFLQWTVSLFRRDGCSSTH
jgi:hypothetical protein